MIASLCPLTDILPSAALPALHPAKKAGVNLANTKKIHTN